MLVRNKNIVQTLPCLPKHVTHASSLYARWSRGTNTNAVKYRVQIQIQIFLACDIVMRLIYTGQNDALPTKQVTHVCSLYARLAGEKI